MASITGSQLLPLIPANIFDSVMVDGRLWAVRLEFNLLKPELSPLLKLENWVRTERMCWQRKMRAHLHSTAYSSAIVLAK